MKPRMEHRSVGQHPEPAMFIRDTSGRCVKGVVGLEDIRRHIDEKLSARNRADTDVVELLASLDGWKIHHNKCWEFYAADRVGIDPTKADDVGCIGRMTNSTRAELASSDHADEDAPSYWVKPYTTDAVELLVDMLGPVMGYEIEYIRAYDKGFTGTEGELIAGMVDFMLRVFVGMRPLHGRRFARVYHYCNVLAKPGKHGRPLDPVVVERWKELGNAFMIDEGVTP